MLRHPLHCHVDTRTLPTYLRFEIEFFGLEILRRECWSLDIAPLSSHYFQESGWVHRIASQPCDLQSNFVPTLCPYDSSYLYRAPNYSFAITARLDSQSPLHSTFYSVLAAVSTFRGSRICSAPTGGKCALIKNIRQAPNALLIGPRSRGLINTFSCPILLGRLPEVSI